MISAFMRLLHKNCATQGCPIVAGKITRSIAQSRAAAGTSFRARILQKMEEHGPMKKADFVTAVFEAARKRGLRVHVNREGLDQICFNEKSKKSLHRGHLEQLHPAILRRGLSRSQMNALIEKVAPGRPCTHRGMREIVGALTGFSAN